jgi:hypothetical protein
MTTKDNIELKEGQKEIQLPVNLWDYFAAHAPHQIITSNGIKVTKSCAREMAINAANFADAMILEREKRMKGEE